MDTIDCLVIGAGVVGLAVARGLARRGREVIVVEAEGAIGTGTSSRNSEVIHAGIYYPTGLKKTRLCVEGKAMLYAFCRDYGVPHRRCGKLIVAANESETAGLAALEAQAQANGVDDLVWLTGEEARALEPALKAERALLSPSTGIIDSHALMLALKGDAEAHGAMVALETPVVSGRAEQRRRDDRDRRRRADGAQGGAGRQRGGPERAGGRPRDRRRSGRENSAAASRQGQLFFPGPPRAVLAARLSDAGAGRPRRPPHPRPCGSGAVRAGCRMGRGDRL